MLEAVVVPRGFRRYFLKGFSRKNQSAAIVFFKNIFQKNNWIFEVFQNLKCEHGLWLKVIVGFKTACKNVLSIFVMSVAVYAYITHQSGKQATAAANIEIFAL